MCSCSLFFHWCSFSPSWPLAFYHFLTAATKFSCCSSNKKCLFSSLGLAVCRPFSCWASLACRLLSLFLCLSLSLYSKFVNMTVVLSLLHWTTRTQKRFPLSAFVFIELSLFHKTRVAIRFPAKITSSCIWVCDLPYLLIELFYIGMHVVLTGRAIVVSFALRKKKRWRYANISNKNVTIL